MGILKAVGDFLFGKDPDIFDEKGQVRHKHPPKKWQDWDARFQQDEFNWRHHKAVSRKEAASGAKSSKPAK